MRYALSVLLIVLAAGCIGQEDTVAGADGIIITNLYVDPPETDVQSGESINIRADVENVGGATARNVVAELVGASWLGGQPVVLYLGELSPPDPRFGQPGHIREAFFTIPSPRLPEGQKANFELKIRVSYDYETTAVAQVNGFSRQHYNTLFQQGKITPPATKFIPASTTRSAPVSISITGSDKLVIGPGVYDEYTYKLTFSNVGSQVPVTPSPVTGRGEDGLVLGAIWVNGPGVFLSRCLGIGPENLINSLSTTDPRQYDRFLDSMYMEYGDRFTAWYQDLPWDYAAGISAQIGEMRIGFVRQPSIPRPDMSTPGYILFPNALSWELIPITLDPIKLRRGQSVTKSCTIGIVNDLTVPFTWNGRLEDSIMLNAHLKYRYFIDQSVRITVSAPLLRQRPL